MDLGLLCCFGDENCWVSATIHVLIIWSKKQWICRTDSKKTISEKEVSGHWLWAWSPQPNSNFYSGGSYKLRRKRLLESLINSTVTLCRRMLARLDKFNITAQKWGWVFSGCWKNLKQRPRGRGEKESAAVVDKGCWGSLLAGTIGSSRHSNAGAGSSLTDCVCCSTQQCAKISACSILLNPHNSHRMEMFLLFPFYR